MTAIYNKIFSLKSTFIQRLSLTLILHNFKQHIFIYLKTKLKLVTHTRIHSTRVLCTIIVWNSTRYE